MNTQRPPLPADADTQPGPDVIQFVLLALRRSRAWILPLIVVGALVGGYVALSQPNVYTSESKLLLRVGSRERVTAESLVTSPLDESSANPTLQAEIQMLQDEAIYEKVAREFGPTEVLRAADPTRDDGDDTPWTVRTMHRIQALVQGVGSDDHVCTPGGCQKCIAAAVDNLRENTRLEADRDSNVILVHYTANSPERARAITQALITAYIERHAEQFSVEPILEKNKPKLEAAQVRREASARAYFDHVQQCGIVDLETQRRVIIEAADTVESAYNAAVLRNDEIKAERASLVARMSASSAQIDLVRERAPNPKYLEMKNRVEDLDVEATTVEARLQRLSSDLATSKERLAGLRECERVHATLGAARDLEEARWRELQQRYSMLEDLGSIDVQADSNLLVLQQPTLNFKKDGPKRAKVVIASLAFACFLGVWLALVREFFDRRLRHAPMVERQLGVRLLGTIPDYSSRDLAA